MKTIYLAIVTLILLAAQGCGKKEVTPEPETPTTRVAKIGADLLKVTLIDPKVCTDPVTEDLAKAIESVTTWTTFATIAKINPIVVGATAYTIYPDQGNMALEVDIYANATGGVRGGTARKEYKWEIKK